MNKLKGKKTIGGWLARYKIYLLLPAVLLCLLVIYAGVLLLPAARSGQAEDVLVEVPAQVSAGQVGEILARHKLVRSGLAFSLWARWKGQDGQIKAGEYMLRNDLSLPQILAELTSGRMLMQTVSIPEGFTTSQIADLLEEKGLISREDFYRAIVSEDYDYYFIQDIPKSDKRLEGYLFPDTYQFTRGIGESDLIKMMLDRFAAEMDGLSYTALSRESQLTLHQVVTIASMVEREAKFAEEMPLIAGVIYSRLAISMPLQIDATVQYALGVNKPQLTYADLEVDSPYNTYRIPGLPPGPIAMPGKPALLAAVHPVITGDYYYVAKPDGYHAFARTLAEHDANKERYLQ